MKPNRQWDHHRSFYAEYGDGEFSCEFCGQSVMLHWDPNKMKFHKIANKAVIHHRDEDRNNNQPLNLAVAHWKCHSSYHRTNKKASQEARRNMSLAHQGKSPTEQTKEKLRAAMKGRPWSAARRAAQRSKGV